MYPVSQNGITLGPEVYPNCLRDKDNWKPLDLILEFDYKK